jgi:cytochrome c oxidase subunit 2
MIKKTGNPNFTYEISCDQMCGQGHFSMRGVIVVETEAEYKKWLAEQTPDYYALFPDKNPAKPATDTAAAAKAIAQTAVAGSN